MKKSFMTIGIVAILLLATLPLAAAAPANVCRHLPSGDQAAGSTITISLEATVDGATYYAIDEIVPTGWTVTSASDSGDYTSDPGHVKWLVIEGAVNKTYTYTVSIPNSASGAYSFTGIYQMEDMGAPAVIDCDTVVCVGDVPVEPGSVCRDLPSGDQAAGSSIVVSLCVAPGSATYYAIDEIVPAGWTVTSASDGGDYTSDPGHVKWVVTDGAVNKTYTYTVSIPNSASGAYSFTGIYQMEGMGAPAAIGCDTAVCVGDVPVEPSSVCRDLPSDNQAAGSSMVVSLCVTPGSATYYAIDEIVPAGWVVTSASDGGDYTSDPGHVKWVVIDGAVNKTYTYTVSIPNNASGAYSFAGIYQMEGMGTSAEIGCDTVVCVCDVPFETGSVCRDLPGITIPPCSCIEVSLCVTPGTATYYAIDEVVPAGWTVSGASDGGDYTSDPGHVKWVVTSGAVNKTYTYTVLVPENANGTYTFNGIFQMEGMGGSAAIGCDTQVQIGELTAGILLYEGWNFVSIPYALENPSFSYIVGGLPVDAVLGYDAVNQTCEHSMNLTWEPLKGYWIHATEDCFIPAEWITKSLPHSPATLQIYEGWNAIGHCDSTDTLYAKMVLESVESLYLYIMGPWDPAELTYTQCGYNGETGIISGKHMGTDVFEMKPYEGFWLYANETGVYAPVGC